MKTSTNIREDIAIVLNELADMRTNCTNEKREPNEDERKAANGLLSRIDELEDMLALETRTQATLDRTKEPTSPPDKTQIDTRKDKTEQEKRDRFASSGEFYQAVMRAGLPGQNIDPRLSTRAGTGLSESVPSDGGFLVDTEMSGGLIKNVWKKSPILDKVSKVTLSGSKNGMKFNGFDETSRATGSRYGGITGYWKNEGAEKTPSSPTFRQIELTLNKLIGLCYATDENLDDASALAQIINEGFTAEFDFLLTDAIINGTGAGTPLGILNSGCMVSVGAEVGQTADTIVYENILKMWSRLMAASRPNSMWLINQNCEPQLHQMSLAVGTGGAPVYLPLGGASVQPFATLMGRPVIPIEQCPVLGDTGDIILADFSQYKAIDKGGLKTDVSIHVQFTADEQVFRFVYRFDGQPVLSKAITPFSAGATTATDTLSHFVKLEAR